MASDIEGNSVDIQRTRMLRMLLDGTAWVRRTREFGQALRTAGQRSSGLLVVGTPDEEPWHLTAHLDDEARWGGLPELGPTLVRQRVEPDAPAHLAVDLERLERSGRGDTLLVVAPGEAPPGLLQRFEDARRRGGTVLALESGAAELRALANESLTVLTEGHRTRDANRSLFDSALHAADLNDPELSGLAFETAQHLVTVAAGEQPVRTARRLGFRDRLGRLLDRISGPGSEGLVGGTGVQVGFRPER